MTDLPTLLTRLEALKAARFSGQRRVSIEGFSVEYASERELAAAIGALESEISSAQGAPRATQVTIRSEKGW